MTATETLRSDARRNRERLIASARELFAKHGADVSVEEITHHAEVGMGTLYRHFPTKEELIDAVLVDAFAGIVDAAERAVEEKDAWAALVHFLEYAIGLHVKNRGLKDVLGVRSHGAKHTQAMRERMRPLLRRMVERAQEQGTLRADFAPEDLPVIFWTSARVIDMTAKVAPLYWRRHLALVLDGLRAEAARPLPERPLTPAQLNRVTKRRNG